MTSPPQGARPCLPPISPAFNPSKIPSYHAFIYLKCKSSAGCVDTSGGGSTGGTTGGSAGGSKTTELSVTPKSRTVGYGATSTSFSVINTGAGTLSWTATVSSGGEWMSISSGSSGTNDGTITAAFSANTTSKSRGGIIRVDASGVTSKYVTVTQEAKAGGDTGGTTGGASGGSDSGGSTGGTTGGSTSGGTTGGSTGSTSGGTTGGSTGGSAGGTTASDTTAPTTTASPSGGTFSSTQSVTLTCADNSGGSGCSKTYYTTDGTTPTTASTVYSSAISISATTTLKFFSVDSVGNQETVKTQAYTITPPLYSVGPQVTDIDGNVYNSVVIGTQTWMKENLKVTKYRDGTAIGATTPATLDISTEISPKYQWAYNGSESNVSAYGRLYTWHAATDSRGVCPSGWHVPTDAEWTTLTDYLGGASVAGGKMKEGSGFTALQGGYRFPQGVFVYGGNSGYWWSATASYTDAWRREVFNNYDSVGFGLTNQSNGFSVRCVKD